MNLEELLKVGAIDNNTYINIVSTGSIGGYTVSEEEDPNWGWTKWKKVFLWKPVKFITITGESKLYWGFTMKRGRISGLAKGPGPEKYQYMSVSDFALQQLQK